jgi:lipoate-protein ligase A
MLIYRNDNTDPYLNLALEEHLLTTSRQDCFMLWRNRPAIIVGRNQNTAEEINAAFVRDRGVAVVRRLSGGGAVYHDLGNLNYTFIAHDSRRSFDFAGFAQPILAVLRSLGVAAEFAGRNDLLIDGRKFSGNAQYVQGGKVLHHGTLLFDSDLTVLGQALAVKPEKYESKGVKSVASRVTNIAPHLPRPITVDQFAAAVLAHIAAAFPGAAPRRLHPRRPRRRPRPRRRQIRPLGMELRQILPLQLPQPAPLRRRPRRMPSVRRRRRHRLRPHLRRLLRRPRHRRTRARPHRRPPRPRRPRRRPRRPRPPPLHRRPRPRQPPPDPPLTRPERPPL